MIVVLDVDEELDVAYFQRCGRWKELMVSRHGFSKLTLCVHCDDSNCAAGRWRKPTPTRRGCCNFIWRMYGTSTGTTGLWLMSCRHNVWKMHQQSSHGQSAARAPAESVNLEAHARGDVWRSRSRGLRVGPVRVLQRWSLTNTLSPAVSQGCRQFVAVAGAWARPVDIYCRGGAIFGRYQCLKSVW